LVQLLIVLQPLRLLSLEEQCPCGDLYRRRSPEALPLLARVVGILFAEAPPAPVKLVVQLQAFIGAGRSREDRHAGLDEFVVVDLSTIGQRSDRRAHPFNIGQALVTLWPGLS